MRVKQSFDKEIDALISEETDFLADGRAKDFTDYKVRCARIETFRSSKIILREKINEAVSEDDDE